MPFYFETSVAPSGNGVYRLAHSNGTDDSVVDVKTIRFLDAKPHKLVIESFRDLDIETIVHAVKLCTESFSLHEVEFCGGQISKCNVAFAQIVMLIRFVKRIVVRDDFFTDGAFVSLAIHGSFTDVEITNCTYNDITIQAFINFAKSSVQSLKITHCRYVTERSFVQILPKCCSLEVLHLYDCAMWLTRAVFDLIAKKPLKELAVDHFLFSEDVIETYKNRRPNTYILFGDCDGNIYDEDGIHLTAPLEVHANIDKATNAKAGTHVEENARRRRTSILAGGAAKYVDMHRKRSRALE